MSVVIRLRQQGKTNRRSFRLVVTDSRAPRDGKYIENLGWYDPHALDDKTFHVDVEKLSSWLEKGALLSENSKALVAKKAPDLIKKYKMRKKKKSKKEKKT